jgi:hypothetical protein
VRALEVGAMLLQQPHAEVDAVLFIGVEAFPPNEEFVGKLDVSFHEVIMDLSA